jgi:hypothetical protein
MFEISNNAINSDAETAIHTVLADKFTKVCEDMARIPGALDAFFASVERNAGKSAAKRIATHAMRGDGVAALVIKLGETVEAEKAAGKTVREAKMGSAE